MTMFRSIMAGVLIPSSFIPGADGFLLRIAAERDRADARAVLAQSDAAVADAPAP